MLGHKMKYIIFDGKFPVIFHPVIVHAEVSAGNYPGKPTSAGFVTLVPIIKNNATESFVNATVHGESISLDLKSGGEVDNDIIERAINEN